ncbi:alpha/beta family hydrolase [Angustibacter sp. McL0619]|uniref:alpha/beta hydrolase family protein n=1 Tax=Angustibacter sp. McL0619 TaxID=3415676 RepID=UPI003CF4B2DA
MAASPAARVLEVETPTGPARAHVRRPVNAVGTMVLGHGAGGGIGAKDLTAAARAGLDCGWAVVLVEQPWRVAGKRVAAPPPRLDEAWLPVVQALRSGRGSLPGPLVLGGRSAGARVACRTATALGAAGVLALAFPLHPPGRPERSRADELALVQGLPLLVVQGRRDPFGGPQDVGLVLPPSGRVVAVDGDHGLSADLPAVVSAVRELLVELAR